MQVGVFYSSISNPNKAPHKIALLDHFAAGVRACGDTVIEYRDADIQPSKNLDAGFLLGYSVANNFRRQIIDGMLRQNIPPIFVDSNILHYSKPEHGWHRYSMQSVYPDSGTYFFGELDNTKWNTYSQWHNASLKPWRQTGNHILILCQRPKGWNMFDKVQSEWLDATIAEIRKFSSRPIRVRMHPGDGKKQIEIDRILQKHKGKIVVSTNANIKQDLEDCWACVGVNSTPNVVSAIEGVPVYVEDPVHSWATDVAFTDLSLIENPPMPDRAEWINKIANIHWSNEEVRAGKLWQSIKNYISSSR